MKLQLAHLDRGYHPDKQGNTPLLGWSPHHSFSALHTGFHRRWRDRCRRHKFDMAPASKCPCCCMSDRLQYNPSHLLDTQSEDTFSCFFFLKKKIQPHAHEYNTTDCVLSKKHTSNLQAKCLKRKCGWFFSFKWGEIYLCKFRANQSSNQQETTAFILFL